MVAGFRLQRTQTLRFCSSSGIYLTRPLTTVLGCASPTSISSTYRESASGCFWAFLIRPTRISSLLMDTSASAETDAPAFDLASADFVDRSFFVFSSDSNNSSSCSVIFFASASTLKVLSA
nr:hypothetical protein PanWU01x14_361300 [Ipomoea batatas]